MCLCRFVGPERLLVLSEKQKDQTLMQLVNTTNGSVVAETLGPEADYSSGHANFHTGLFIGESSYDTLLTIQTAGDKLQFSTYECGQIYSGPRIGPDGQCYVIVHYQLYRVEGDQKQPVMPGSNCICFHPPAKVYCGGGYADRSGESNLHVADLQSGENFKISWGNEPIDEIVLADNERLLVSNTISETYSGRYPNATVTLYSVAGRKKEWSLTISDLKPKRRVILASAPEEGWTLIQTGTLLKRIALQDGNTTHVLQKHPKEFVTARWLVSKKLLYIARKPDRNKPGMLEAYSI
jgi:hypothetical protein